MLQREIIAVGSEIHTKQTNTLCGQNLELLNVKLMVHIVTTCVWRINILVSRLPETHLSNSRKFQISAMLSCRLKRVRAIECWPLVKFNLLQQTWGKPRTVPNSQTMYNSKCGEEIIIIISFSFWTTIMCHEQVRWNIQAMCVLPVSTLSIFHIRASNIVARGFC
jgi:hypothetical protein